MKKIIIAIALMFMVSISYADDKAELQCKIENNKLMSIILQTQSLSNQYQSALKTFQDTQLKAEKAELERQLKELDKPKEEVKQ